MTIDSYPPFPQAPLTDDDSRKWTVMVFMGVNTEEGNAPLVAAARADLLEMTKGVSAGRGPGPDAKLNVFAQVHGEGEPWRYHIGLSEKPVPKDQQDIGDGQALMHFIIDSLRTARHRPGYDRSMLVLWGHAYDFAIGKATTRSGTVDALDFAELKKVLMSLMEQARRAFGIPDPRLDIVGFDACDVATVELACQLHGYADYLVGSQIGVPIPGWPYDRVLERLQDPQGRLMGAAEFGSWIVRRFCEAYTSQRSVSLSLLDLKRAPELFARTKVLAMVLNDAIDRDIDFLDALTDLFSRSLTAEDKPYVDVADLCLNLMREVGDPLVNEAARALGDFLITPSDNVVKNSPTGEGWPFVAAFGRNAGATARLNGISLYAPHVSLANDFVAVRVLYDKFDFARDTQWSELVHTLAQHAELELEAEESI